MLVFYRAVMIHCITPAALTQFPLEALYSRRYTFSGPLSYVVFELLGMMLFAFKCFVLDALCDKKEKRKDPA